VEIAPDQWRMSKKDGKSVLLGGVNKKGFWSVKISEVQVELNEKAALSCPVKVIQVR
jgi:ferredoxin